jgi:phenylalanyl-tRNA synthetase beta subunit
VVYVEGRVDPIGVVGELHPEVLAGERGFGIRVPCAAFEVALSPLAGATPR